MNAGTLSVRLVAVLFASTAVALAKSTPVQIEETVPGQFPASLAHSTLTTGEARVMVNIDADGNLADTLVTGYTDPAFAVEAISLLRQWRYRPATVDGEPVGVRFELKLTFEAKGRVISLLANETVTALTQNFLRPKLVAKVCRASELDHPVSALETVSPYHPGTAVAGSGRTGTALLDFYIDETGRTRMPVVLATTSPNFAQAAVGALRQWRFATPTRSGQPVAVRVQQEFVFPAES